MNLHGGVERLHRLAVLVLHEVRVEIVDELVDARIACVALAGPDLRDAITHGLRRTTVLRVRMRRTELLVVASAFGIVRFRELTVGEPTMPADVRKEIRRTVLFTEGLHDRALVFRALALRVHARIRAVVIIEAASRVERAALVARDDRSVCEERRARLGEVARRDVARLRRLIVAAAVVLRANGSINRRGTANLRDGVVTRHDGVEHRIPVPAAFEEPVDEVVRRRGLLRDRARDPKLFRAAGNTERFEEREPVHHADGRACTGC